VRHAAGAQNDEVCADMTAPAQMHTFPMPHSASLAHGYTHVHALVSPPIVD
jgi:hypothetical protein